MDMQTNTKFMAIFALIAGVVITGAAHAGLVADEVPSTPEKPSGSGKLAAMSDHDLAYRFLSARETLRGQLGAVYQDLKALREEGQEPSISVDYVMHSLDGTASYITLNGMDDIEKLLDLMNRGKKVYGHQMRLRGSLPILPRYRVVASDVCSPEWIQSGNVTVEENGLSFLLRQGEKAFEGAVVGESVTVVFPGGAFSPLVGSFKSRQHIKLKDARSSCIIRLIPDEDLAQGGAGD